MRSETSSSKGGLHSWFHPTLYKKNMTRFWPIWALYGAIWLLALPVALLASYAGVEGSPFMAEVFTGEQYFARCYVAQILPMGAALSVGFGLLAAMAVFSYLYQGRSVGLMHALPIRREGLFVTNYLSGLSFLALPLLAVFFLTLGAELLCGAVYFPGLFTWLTVNLLTGLFFYSFAVFCAMFTGHILALPAFYGILNGLAPALYFLFDNIFNQFLYGYDHVEALAEGATWLAPALRLLTGLGVEEVLGPDGHWAYAVTGLLPVFFYALVGLALAGLALVVYRRRQLECAGDVISLAWVKPVFRYGVSFCMAVSLGVFLHELFLGRMVQTPWALLGFMIAAGILGYFVAEMLLQKSFRVFALRNWGRAGLLSLALILGVCGMELDVTGFERRIPDPAQVESVWVGDSDTYPLDEAGWGGFTCTGPEEIALITRLHAALVAERAEEDWGGSYEGRVIQGYNVDTEIAGSCDVALQYTLLDGSSVYRRYTLHATPERLADPDSAAALYQELVNRPDVIQELYFGNWLGERAEEARLIDVALTYPDSADYQDGYGNGRLELDLDDQARADLLAAIQADMAAGDLGRRYLLEDEERYTNCYYNDLYLTFYLPENDPQMHEEADTLRVSAAEISREITVTLQASARNTLDVLFRNGLDPDLLQPLYQWYGQAASAGQPTAEGTRIG